jgi:hypothetical protein
MQLTVRPPTEHSVGLLALFGLALTAAHHSPTEALTLDEPTVQLRWLDYQERQDGLDRIKVEAWSTRAVINFNDSWGVQAYSVVDTISGASPVYYASPQAFASVTDKRKAHDLRLVHVTGQYRIAIGENSSRENDYTSQGRVVQLSRSSADQNMTLDMGVSQSKDLVSPVNKAVRAAPKNSDEQLLGVRWNASPVDALQFQWTRASLKGYLSDPYKFLDQRPDQRIQSTLLFRWNHHIREQDSTIRWTTRGVHDTWGAHSLMSQIDWSTPLAPSWRITPSVRYYTQNAARFFSNPDPKSPLTPNIPRDFVFGQSALSMDQRLSAFGAITLGFQIDKTINKKNQINLRLDSYKQRGQWSAMQSGTEGVADFKAKFIQLGWTHFLDR